MREEVPEWCWYNGLLLFALSDALETNPDESVGDFFKRFKASNQLTMVNFNLKNQGLLISLLYGLLVVPREIWEPPGKPTSFAFATRGEFVFHHSQPANTTEFLRLFRNAVAHANFDVIPDQGRYRFWNINLKGQKNFEVSISHGGLGAFVTEIGKYFLNEVRHAH